MVLRICCAVLRSGDLDDGQLEQAAAEVGGAPRHVTADGPVRSAGAVAAVSDGGRCVYLCACAYAGQGLVQSWLQHWFIWR